MRQGNIPFGYKVIDGNAVVDDTESVKLKQMYKNYLDGKSLVSAAKEAGINCDHGSVSRMLLNKKYLGDEYYPPLIDKQIYDRVVEEKEKRATALGRVNRIKPKKEVVLPMKFKMRKPTQKLRAPFADAAYLYSLIERED